MLYICFLNWITVFLLYSVTNRANIIWTFPNLTLKSCDPMIYNMLSWVSMGFLISLDLWYYLIFVCRIQYFIPFCSARQKFSFFFRIQWLIPSCSFLLLSRIEWVKPFWSLLLLCSIQWFIPNFSAGQKILFFCRTKWFISICWFGKKLFFSFGIQRFIPFSCVRSLPLPFVFQHLTNWLKNRNLIQYPISLLWNCFLQYPLMSE